jgi:AcrR family transcriptional regulator
MREASRTAVLGSAMKLFAQNGYANTTTRAIAEEAGISIGLMYHYFESKEDLLRAVFDNCMDILSGAFSTALEENEPQLRLENLLAVMFQMLVEDEPFWSLFYMLRSQPAIMALLGDDFRTWTQRLRFLFETELRQQRRSDPYIDSLILYCLIDGAIQQYLLDPTGCPLELVTEQILDKYAR